MGREWNSTGYKWVGGRGIDNLNGRRTTPMRVRVIEMQLFLPLESDGVRAEVI